MTVTKVKKMTVRKPANPAPHEQSRARRLDDWARLGLLITALSDAAIAESWKGAGPPEDVEVMETRLRLAEAELNAHVTKMRRDEE